MGILALCRSPRPVVVERSTALTVGASGVVLADADILDLGDESVITSKDLSRKAHSLQTNLPAPQDPAWTHALPGHHIQMLQPSLSSCNTVGARVFM